ncbi:branched-chain amino acid ABC transporter permease [Paraburkholderia susongensis]|uniref:Amino acid/amide ABC transporter membrane protein 2, HAAT family n=1 Tax=Paraburkholderia susongensis TaxID=1515439 RepID=A0A1X7KKM9_9BURK|nr:branched-chain amino acid ABC transporter permease [Paraburkholderia susongensis]SMG41955.1 amino acid/amide ABC transporter membrane protein 2, HAAT family [Paraburkholderia susongensis]
MKKEIDSKTLLQVSPLQPRRANVLSTVALVLVAVAVLLPLLLADQPFTIVMFSHAFIAAMLAVSLDMLTGNTGLLSFGHAAWFGFGAYVAGLLARSLTADLLLVLVMTALPTLIFALIVGAIFLRQVGKTFAILTLAFSQVLYSLVFVAGSTTGGEDGLQGVPAPTLFGITLAGQNTWYWLLLGVLLAMIAGVLYLRSTPLGRAWLGLRDNAQRARFIGMDVFRLKLIAYAVSATLASLTGALFVLFNGAVTPEVLGWFQSGKILMYVVLGGVGSVVGPALGAIVFTFAENAISSFTDAWMVYFGALFVIVVIVAPGGLYGLFEPLRAKLLARSGTEVDR